MASKTIDAPLPLLEVDATLGGSPLPEPIAPGEDEKEIRRRRKREAKLRREAERPPESFERFRILMNVVDQGRRVVDLCDHKARYALVVMGVLNAGVFFLISRAHLIAGLPAGVKPWLLGFLVAYGGLTFVFVLYAIDTLRPRQLRYGGVVPDNPLSADPTVHHRPLGLLYWETVARHDLEEYCRAWSVVRMEQLNAEVVAVSHYLARLLQAKYAALGRLYVGLVILVGLAAALLAVYTGFAIFS
jgi:hypothetical protein